MNETDIPVLLANAMNYLDVGSFVVSCISLGLTIWLLYGVRQLRKSYLLKARLPEIHDVTVKEHEKMFEILHNWTDDDAEHKFLKHVAVVRQRLSRVRAILNRSEKREISKFLQQHLHRRERWRKIPIQSVGINQAWNIYNELNGILARLGDIEKDGKWR